VQFYGADAETLKAAAEALKTRWRAFPEVSAVEDNLAYDKEELILDLTPQGQALGFTIDTLGRCCAPAERDRGGDLSRRAAQRTIRVELPEGELTADFLDRMQMRTPRRAYVPLADIVSVERRTGFSTVRRENGLRARLVTGDISEDDPARAEPIMQALETEILPRIEAERQVDYRLSGWPNRRATSCQRCAHRLILCLLGIYLVLAWVFASWTRPLVVMAIIPFGLSARSTAIASGTCRCRCSRWWASDRDDRDHHQRFHRAGDHHRRIRQGTRPDPAIIDGAADRLRPVLLTTLTTVLGLAPLLYETSQQAQFLKPTVITLVYGLGFGMVLVLLVVPALWRCSFGAGRGHFRRHRHAQPVRYRLDRAGGGTRAGLRRGQRPVRQRCADGGIAGPVGQQLPRDVERDRHADI
jgi:multidrug efflux pump subunit AcrB